MMSQLIQQQQNISKELEETKKSLEKTRQMLENTKQELNQTKELLNNTVEKLKIGIFINIAYININCLYLLEIMSFGCQKIILALIND